MRIIFAGTPDAATPTLKLLSNGHEIVSVLTRPDARQGRGRKTVESPVAQVAAELGIEVIKTATLRCTDVHQQIMDLKPDLGVVVAYGAFVPQALLDAFPWINLHFSLLPRWRGAAPVQHAIAAGDSQTGISVFELVQQMDAGPIYKTVPYPISADDTTDSLLSKLAHDGAEIVTEVIRDIEQGVAKKHEQYETGMTLAPQILVSEAAINWSLSASQIDCQVRAMTSNPGAWSELNGKRIKIGPLTPIASQSLAPGAIKIEKNRIVVGCGQGSVELGKVAPAGKSWMEAADWGRGFHGSAELKFEWENREL